MPRAGIRIRVPFVDVDSSQRIHFTAMFRYFEVTEHELMRSIGLTYATSMLEAAFPRVHLSCDFKGAVRYDDLLDVEARVERVGTSSWTVAFTARRAAEQDADTGGMPGEIVATGRMTIVAMDPVTEKSIPLPEELKRGLTQEE